jgi:hypothetical protein
VPWPTDVDNGDFLKREAVKSVLRGEAYYVELDHYDQPDHCILVEDYDGGMACVPDPYIQRPR